MNKNERNREKEIKYFTKKENEIEDKIIKESSMPLKENMNDYYEELKTLENYDMADNFTNFDENTMQDQLKAYQMQFQIYIYRQREKVILNN